MFCPVGYVPFSAVGVEYFEWFSFLVHQSIDASDPLQLSGVPQERRARTILSYGTRSAINFLETCSSTSICSPTGSHLKIDTLQFLERADMLWEAAWFPDELKINSFRLVFVDQDRFTIKMDFWEREFSTILKQNSLEDWGWLQENAEIISFFEGWAICVSEEEAEDVPKHITDRLGISLPSPEETPELGGDAKSHRKAGRPPLLRARAEYARMGYQKGERSWEQLGRLLELQTGQKPSPRTLRAWTDQGNSMSPGENQGENEGKRGR